MVTASPLESPRRTVLVVEDEPMLRASMVKGLAKLSSVALVDAGSLREARRLAELHRPVLVVSDLDLPDGSGIEMASTLDELGLRVPILFVSAYVREYQGRLPKRPGIEVYEKPLPLERLRSAVEAHLGIEAEASPFGVIDFVQLAGMGRRSVVIEVRGRIAGSGRIVIRAGEVWSARDERGEGMEAFKRLAFLRDAVVTCRSFDRRDSSPRIIQGGCESVLLEAARQYDEAGGAPPERDELGDLDEGWDSRDAGRGDSWEGSARSHDPVVSSTPVPPGRHRSEVRPVVPEPRGEWRSATLTPAVDEPPPTQPSTRLRDVDPRELATVARLAAGFSDVYERGVDALLAKDYRKAYAAFLEARELSPEDRRVEANLVRLREMGFGT
ncbi:MAG: response regulator [Polyangiaceae bacterium]